MLLLRYKDFHSIRQIQCILAKCYGMYRNNAVASYIFAFRLHLNESWSFTDAFRHKLPSFALQQAISRRVFVIASRITENIYFRMLCYIASSTDQEKVNIAVGPTDVFEHFLHCVGTLLRRIAVGKLRKSYRLQPVQNI
jgi:hypothetical protein